MSEFKQHDKIAHLFLKLSNPEEFSEVVVLRDIVALTAAWLRYLTLQGHAQGCGRAGVN